MSRAPRLRVTLPSRQVTRRAVRRHPGGLAVLATGVLLLLAGCTSDADSGNGEPDTTTTPPTASTSAPSESPPAPTPEPIEFVYQPPDPPCPPVSALETLPLAEEHPYALVDPVVFEDERELTSHCTYERADLADVAGSDEDPVLEDHVLITSEIALYRTWTDSEWSGIYPGLPVSSTDLDDWRVAGIVKDREVWWEGCGPATPCEDGQEPTVQTYVRWGRFSAHVGNLEFYVQVGYIAEDLPADAEERALEVFRDLVLAVVDSRERADAE